MRAPTNGIWLIEDHDEALTIWRKKNVRNVDLVHVDAHLDFGFHRVRPVQEVVGEARSLEELKQGLERAIAFEQYGKGMDRQTNLGNYIYPAMREGIVKDFYWVVPGRLKEFKESADLLVAIVMNLTSRADPVHRTCRARQFRRQIDSGVLRAAIFDRHLIICTLERLPMLRQAVLLDIDTDFLVIDNVLKVDHATPISKRRPWMVPHDLVASLKEKIRQPEVITIAYSVNGGYTPITYRHFGTEIASHLAPEVFRSHFETSSQAACHFARFLSTANSRDYWQAAEIDPAYRCVDNNDGPLYLSQRRFSRAEEAFSAILRVDPIHPGCLYGLGHLALERGDLRRAKEHFASALHSDTSPLFTKVRNQSLLGLARAEFGLGNLKRAGDLLARYQALEPFQPESYYLLGRISEKEKDLSRAADLYRHAIRLGLLDIEPIWRLLFVAQRLGEKDGLLHYGITRYREFKKAFEKERRKALKEGRKPRGLREIEKRMTAIEKMLRRTRANKGTSSIEPEHGLS